MQKVTIITPSFNKHEYVKDAIQSVIDQTFKDWQYWIIENSHDGVTREIIHQYTNQNPRIKIIDMDFSPADRKSFYITAFILNQVYPLVDTKYLFYLSDDDLLKENCLEEMVNFLEANPKIKVCYHTQSLHIIKLHRVKKHPGITANKIRGGKTKHPVLSKIDGGQIMHHTSCLKKIDQPYFPEGFDKSAVCDGIFMEKLAKHWEFHPLPNLEPLSVRRRTPKSTWVRSWG